MFNDTFGMGISCNQMYPCLPNCKTIGDSRLLGILLSFSPIKMELILCTCCKSLHFSYIIHQIPNIFKILPRYGSYGISGDKIPQTFYMHIAIRAAITIS